MTKLSITNQHRQEIARDNAQKLLWALQADITYHAVPGLDPDRAVFTLDYLRSVGGAVRTILETIEKMKPKGD